MNATELMIGDWILAHYTYTSKVTEIHANGSICTDLDGRQIDDTDFEPIPLTPEILEMNGFTYDDRELCWKLVVRESKYAPVYSIYVSARRISIYNWKNENGEPFTDACNKVNVHYKYVHEIQHALRLSGLHEIADNFKVE